MVKEDWRKRIRLVETFLLVFLFSIVVSSLFIDYGEQQFSYLAQSFLQGNLDISKFPTALNDSAFYLGKYYWPLGPFPAVLLMPFVYIFTIFDLVFFQKYVQVPLVFAIIFFCYKISKKIGFNSKDAVYLSIAFTFASPFVAIIQNSWSWQFAMVVSVFLQMAAIYEYLIQRRYIIIGVLYACLLLTRTTAALGILFFVLEIILRKITVKRKAVKLGKLLAPFFVAVILFLCYNIARFGNFFEQGYSYQLSSGGVLRAREYGLFNPIHIPGNLYYFLFAAPTPVLRDGMSRVLKFPYLTFDLWGMGIFFTSPWLIYLFLLKYKDVISRLLWLTVVFVALPILLYYGIGVHQFGYRYALDFFPYLFWILLINYKRRRGNLSAQFKLTIILSTLFNLYLLSTH